MINLDLQQWDDNPEQKKVAFEIATIIKKGLKTRMVLFNLHTLIFMLSGTLIMYFAIQYILKSDQVHIIFYLLLFIVVLFIITKIHSQGLIWIGQLNDQITAFQLKKYMLKDLL